MVDCYFQCCCMGEFAGYSWSEGKTSSQLEKGAGDVVWTAGSSAGMISASVVEESAGEVHVEKLLAPLCNPRHPDEAKNSEVAALRSCRVHKGHTSTAPPASAMSHLTTRSIHSGAVLLGVDAGPV